MRADLLRSTDSRQPRRVPRPSFLGAAVLAAFAATSTTASAATPAAAPGDRGAQRIAVVVDEALYPSVEDGLKAYCAAVRERFPVSFDMLVGPFASAPPREIRDRLREAHAATGPPLRGAILVGALPCPARIGGRTVVPTPLYYEDFDAEWVDADGDGLFEEVRSDRARNATEIWTAWWVPPADDPEDQADLMNGFLRKLVRYHREPPAGRDGFFFIASPINSTEITEAWTVLLKGVLASAGQDVRILSRCSEDADAVHPDPGPEFASSDLSELLASRRWLHGHTVTHGSPSGYYWNDQSLTSRNLDFTQFHGTGPELLTTSGCSNGNFRGGLGRTPAYAESIGNRMLFAENTATVAYFGSASPQSTGVFAMYFNELMESLMPDRDSFIAEGYYGMRNADHAWGIEHYFFRGVDEKILSGDPFFRYRSR